jgi:hypothetical protein
MCPGQFSYQRYDNSFVRKHLGELDHAPQALLANQLAIALPCFCYGCAIGKSMAVLSADYDLLRFTTIIQRDDQWLARGLRLRLNVAPSYKSSGSSDTNVETVVM